MKNEQNNNEEMRPNTLNCYEIACVTSGVPMTQDKILDMIIVAGLKYKTAADILGHLRGQLPESAQYDPIALAEEAVRLSNALYTVISRPASPKPPTIIEPPKKPLIKL